MSSGIVVYLIFGRLSTSALSAVRECGYGSGRVVPILVAGVLPLSSEVVVFNECHYVTLAQ